MRFLARALTIVLAALAGGTAADLPAPTSAVGQETSDACHGLAAPLARVPWTSSRVRGSPDPPAPYRTERLFPNLQFTMPLELARAPGQERLYVVEQEGKIYSFPLSGDSSAELFFDVGHTTYGLAFHPDFEENGYVFVCYVLDPAVPDPRGTRVSRFRVFPHDPLHCDPASETVVIEWLAGGHNGGCLQFGPDGYLYIATGDGSGIADEHQTGQDVSDLLSSILRIDVDRPAPALPSPCPLPAEGGEGTSAGGACNYGIPPDNPFVGVEGARPEIWAYGLRQPWKMSFDRETGDLWAGEVGQDLWEMIYRIERGGNYGWSVTEGRHSFRPERALGPTPILPPVVDHPHSQFRSITGGFVYRGPRLPELAGTYIYGDYDTGKIWGLRYEDGEVTWHGELVDTPLRVVAFGEDNAGELYILCYTGSIHRLVPREPSEPVPEFPRLLSETGLFASTADHAPAPGLIPYSVNAPLWSDHAHKERFIALPGDAQIVYNSQTSWTFAEGAVLVKTFSLEMELGNPGSRRRLETRLLHIEQNHWRGYTYVWNDAQTDAVLLEGDGLDRTYTVLDPAAPGGRRRQTWHFPSRAECSVCHTMPANFVLGLNTLQMNRAHDYGGTVENQLRHFERLGVFTEPLPDSPENLPRLPEPLDEASGTLDQRARAYLHANCAHCHMMYGGGNAAFQMLYTLELADTGLLSDPPAQGTFGIEGGRLLVPGDPERSLIHYRMATLGEGRMPRVGSSVVDQQALELIGRWIDEMPAQ